MLGCSLQGFFNRGSSRVWMLLPEYFLTRLAQRIMVTHPNLVRLTDGLNIANIASVRRTPVAMMGMVIFLLQSWVAPSKQ